MITIGRADWNAIRAEYIGGTISQRKLAEKHGVSVDTLIRRANREHWKKQRDEAYNEITSKIQQRTASGVAENAEIAADLKRKLLLRLKQMEEKYPFDATEVRQKKGDTTVIFRIKELTAAYRDLTDDVAKEPTNSEPVRIVIDV